MEPILRCILSLQCYLVADRLTRPIVVARSRAVTAELQSQAKDAVTQYMQRFLTLSVLPDIYLRSVEQYSPPWTDDGAETAVFARGRVTTEQADQLPPIQRGRSCERDSRNGLPCGVGCRGVRIDGQDRPAPGLSPPQCLVDRMVGTILAPRLAPLWHVDLVARPERRR